MRSFSVRANTVKCIQTALQILYKRIDIKVVPAYRNKLVAICIKYCIVRLGYNAEPLFNNV